MVCCRVGLVDVDFEGVFRNIFRVKSYVDCVCIDCCWIVYYRVGIIFVVSNVCWNFFIVVVDYFDINIVFFCFFGENCEFSWNI